MMKVYLLTLALLQNLSLLIWHLVLVKYIMLLMTKFQVMLLLVIWK